MDEDRKKSMIEVCQTTIECVKNSIDVCSKFDISDFVKSQRDEIFEQIKFCNKFEIDDFDYDEFVGVGIAVTSTGKIISFGSRGEDIWEYVREEYKAK